jgi:hypothetical protein
MSNNIPEDEDLRIDLRGFDFINKEKKKEEKEDSLVIDDSSIVLDGPSLIIGDDIDISDDSLVLGEGAELEDNTEDKTDIKSGNVLLGDDFVVDEFTSNVSDNKDSSIFSSNISDEGISLEGGLDIKDDGQVASWSVDLGDFSGEDDSLIGSNEETLLAGSDSIHDEDEPASILIDDSISGISDIKPEDILNIKKKQEEIYKTKSYQSNEFNGWLLAGIMILSGFMLFGCLLMLDVLIGLNCQEIGCNCGHPVIANALYELIYGG